MRRGNDELKTPYNSLSPQDKGERGKMETPHTNILVDRGKGIVR
jgi:hypothetical protein